MMPANDTKIINELRTTLSKMEISLSVINDAIIWVSAEGLIKWCNKTFTELVNISYIETLTKPIAEILPLKINDVRIDWFTELHSNLQQNNKKHFQSIYEYTSNNKLYYLELFSNFFQQNNLQTIVIVLHDITEREQALERANFLAAFPENNPAPIFSLTRDNQLIYANPRGQRLSQYWEHIYDAKLPSEFNYLKDRALAEQKEYLIEQTVEDAIYLFSITPGATLEYVNIYGTNITERKKSEEKVVYLSNHDILTNLYNRKAFEEILKDVIDHSIKRNTSFAVLMIDLDNFKTVNDTFGHHIGDQLLVNVAQQLKSCVRSSDIIARLGGDEFVILIPYIDDKTDVQHLAQNLINRFNKPFKVEDHYFHATVSIGIALSSGVAQDSSTLIKNADIALYAVKELGKNNFQFFTDEVSNIFQRRTRLESSLSMALENNQFFLVYQPQYRLPAKEIVGLEALVRWQHPELGLIYPRDLIPIAEKNGFIIKLGEWIMLTAISQFMKWQKQHVIPHDMKLAINISARQLADPHFYDSFIKILEQTGCPAKNLEFEITESALMSSLINLDDILEKLKGARVNISIDDFGAGYSSLSRLKTLPINSLKIDRLFIQDLDTNAEGAMIVKSIIALGNSLGLNVIPEGVETQKQLDILQQLNCKVVQGYYFGTQPIKADAMTTFLKKNLIHHD